MQKMILGILLNILLLTSQGGDEWPRSERICLPLRNNEAKVEQLVNRVTRYYEASTIVDWKDRWKSMARFDYWRAQESGEIGLPEDAKSRELFRRTRIIEWNLLRVLQCGPVAKVLVRQLHSYQHDGEIETDKQLAFATWAWSNEEWYIGGPVIDDYLESRPVDWDEDRQTAWVENPREDFLEVWVSPVQVPHQVGNSIDALPEVEPPYRLGPGGGIRDVTGTVVKQPGLEGRDRHDLHGAICAYHGAVVIRDPDRVSEFWLGHSKALMEEADEVMRAVEADVLLSRFRPDRIQVNDELRMARVEGSFFHDSGGSGMKRDGGRLRVVSFWFKSRDGWYRVPAPSIWREHDARDLHTEPCTDGMLRGIVVEDPVDLPE